MELNSVLFEKIVEYSKTGLAEKKFSMKIGDFHFTFIIEESLEKKPKQLFLIENTTSGD